jgi:hypothetical protein
LNVFNPIPECKIITRQLDSSLEKLSQNELRIELSKEEFLSRRYQLLTLALHKLPRTNPELTLQDFPLKVQRSFINRIRLFAGSTPQNIKDILSHSINHHTISIVHLKKYVSPLEFALGQKESILTDIFIEQGAQIASLKLHTLETRKLFWLVPALKSFSDDSLVLSMLILERGFKENNSALVDAIFNLGHVSGTKFHYSLTLAMFFRAAINSENDEMISVFRKYDFEFDQEGGSPLELAAKDGHFKRVAELLERNLHDQRNFKLIEKALEIANENQGSIYNFFAGEKVDFNQTIATLTEFKEKCLYSC